MVIRRSSNVVVVVVVRGVGRARIEPTARWRCDRRPLTGQRSSLLWSISLTNGIDHAIVRWVDRSPAGNARLSRRPAHGRTGPIGFLLRPRPARSPTRRVRALTLRRPEINKRWPAHGLPGTGTCHQPCCRMSQGRSSAALIPINRILLYTTDGRITVTSGIEDKDDAFGPVFSFITLRLRTSQHFVVYCTFAKLAHLILFFEKSAILHW